MSAATVTGTQNIVNIMARELDKLPPIRVYEPEQAPVTDENDNRLKKFEIRIEDGIYIVEADWRMSVFGNINPDDYESLQYFQRVLRSSGIIDKLEEMGVQEGDTVSILDFDFDYVK